MRPSLASLRSFLLLVAGGCVCGSAACEDLHSPRIATFSTDITIPIGHRCMGVLKTKSKQIDDPLEARGLVLLGSGSPVVLVALDWCEVRNASYDQWRDALAAAARTTRQRVLVCSLHQHDAPVIDAEAQDYLDSVGLPGELFDRQFHARCVQQAALALRDAITNSKPLTHIGIGQAKVDRIASNRRVVHADGSIHFDRYSRMSPDSFQAQAAEGEIDPMLKSITFYTGDTAIAVVSSYATHPMSHYGQGAVSADFVGLARRRRQTDTPGTFQIYVSGCSGDVTAGKYNDGAPETRGILADRLYGAMKKASRRTDKRPIERLNFRHQSFQLPFHEGESLTRMSMDRVLHDGGASVEDRITAAMGLSSLDRVERGQPIDLPCLDFGDTKVTLLPGESFVKYQLISQELRPDSFVMAIGYGECWPGYVPTDRAFQEGFGHGWRWVGRGCEAIIRDNLDHVLGP
jgi:hypothetical protein